MASTLTKSLSRLSRESLVDLCLKWSRSSCSEPYLSNNRDLVELEEEDYLHEPAQNVDQLQELYLDVQRSATGNAALSKRDIIDRIIDGDWRRGLTLHQHAMINFAHLEQCDTALRWSALKLVHESSFSECSSFHPAKRQKRNHAAANRPQYPVLNPSTFVTNLRSHIAPLVKAHYTLHRLSSGLVILRLYIVPNSAFAPSKTSIPRSPKQATDAARVVYIALPDSCPYVYISLSGSGSNSLTDSKTSIKSKLDITTTKKIVLEALPKALSRPQERWKLESTKLTTRSLRSICLLRGNGRPGTAGGAYSKFSDRYQPVPLPSIEHRDASNKLTAQKSEHRHSPTNPLRVQLPTPPPEEETEIHLQVVRRFGPMSGQSHAALNRFHVKISNCLHQPSHRVLGKQGRSGAPGGRKRKRLSLEEIENGAHHTSQGQTLSKQDEEPSLAACPASMALTFSGSDVFAGLRQLALLGPDYIDLSRLPAWLTGEQGVSSTTV